MPSEPKSSSVRQLDVPYSAYHTDRRLIDVFTPAGRPNGCCLFFIHGGGWRAGDKESWHPVMEHFCRLGFVCTSAEYRLMPDAYLEDMVDDLRLAMSFVKARGDECGFDPGRIAAYGSSAGGHLVGMLATIAPGDELGITDEVAIRDTRPQAAVCMCPVLSLTRYKLELIPQLLGPEWSGDTQRVPLASPECRLTGQEPPFLICVGDEDTVTPLAMQYASRDALQASNVPLKLAVVPGAEHGAFYGASTPHQKQALAHVEGFLQEVFDLPGS